MKLSTIFSTAVLATSYANAHTLPQDTQDIETRDARNVWHPEVINIDDLQALEKRKGGGGRGSSGGSSSGSSSSGSSSSGSGGRTGSSSGTSSSSGSSGVSYRGTQPSYNGAYRGGATRPYGSGATSRGGISPFLLPGAALIFLPGALLAGAYLYSFPRPYNYYNQTSATNETSPVNCYCEPNTNCGCDESDDQNYVNDVIGNGSYAYMQENGLAKAPNGTLYINGTLSSDTEAIDGESAAGGRQSMIEAAGWWVTVAVVGATVWTGVV